MASLCHSGAGQADGAGARCHVEQHATFPECLKLANKLAKERDLGMEKTTQSMKTLYEALTPDQRKIIDQYGPRFNS